MIRFVNCAVSASLHDAVALAVPCGTWRAHSPLSTTETAERVITMPCFQRSNYTVSMLGKHSNRYKEQIVRHVHCCQYSGVHMRHENSSCSSNLLGSRNVRSALDLPPAVHIIQSPTAWHLPPVPKHKMYSVHLPHTHHRRMITGSPQTR